MLTAIADGVHVHTSATLQTNSTIVEGRTGVLVIDPGLTDAEMTSLAADITAMGLSVAAGFATHPDWDHVLWHADLGRASRFATVRAHAFLQPFLAQPGWRDDVEEGLPPDIAGQVPLELFGALTPLPPDASTIPWDGPRATVLEHHAHAEGHAAVLLNDRRVLVAGDMLSDVFVPMPDLHGVRDDPLGDYLAGLQTLEDVATDVDVVIPGHGAVCDGDEFKTRIARDRDYIHALRDGRSLHDPRLDTPAPGWEWVSSIHEGNVSQAARRR